MALLRMKEIRAMDPSGRDKKLGELRDELMHERGVAAMGGAPPNPGKIRALRKNIARIHTVQRAEGPAAAPSASREKAAEPAPAAEGRRRPRRAREPVEEEIDEDDQSEDEEGGA